MRIQNLKVKDFRNIVRADVNFGKINILTGKNSSGKSNFLLALGASLSDKKDYSDLFSNNVVTFHPGKNNTVITSTISDINQPVCYILGSEEEFFCLDANEFTFEKIIDKNGYSKSHRLFFTGDSLARNKDSEGNVKYRDFWNNTIEREHATQELVYEEVFNREKEQEAIRVVQVEKNAFENQQEYLNFFSSLNSRVISWVGKSTDSRESRDSRDLPDIHRFVAERGTRETYEEAADRIRPRKGDEGYSVRKHNFNRSKFIFLLADIQRNEKYIESFQSDLKTYTDGIVTNIVISNKGQDKGEIIIDSPNGPRDIWTISQGTSVLLFFILLLNWARLPEQEKSYHSPYVMILDEIDSLIHPTLITHFQEVLRALSEKIQLFLSSHSPYFIDSFEKKELFLMKDSPSMPGTNKLLGNRCNIYDYEKIISKLPENDKKTFSDMRNSELFVEGLIDSIFPHNEYD